MRANAWNRFDLDALRDLAGDKVFVRGQAYHRDGQVEILAIEPERILAQVAGFTTHEIIRAPRSPSGALFARLAPS